MISLTDEDTLEDKLLLLDDLIARDIRVQVKRLFRFFTVSD